MSAVRFSGTSAHVRGRDFLKGPTVTALATALRIEATPYTPAHAEAVLDVLSRVAAESTYPAVGRTRSELAAWLLEGTCTGRWVVLADGVVAGHIATAPPRSRLSRALDEAGHTTGAPAGISEIGRFFTDPDLRGLGLGSALFVAACAAAEETGHQPALALPDSAVDAGRFAASHGLEELGLFVDGRGLTHLLVRDPAATRADRLEAMRAALYNLLG